MSPLSDLSATPPLSSSFNKARLLSRIMAVLLACGFWGNLIWLAAMALLVTWPNLGAMTWRSVHVSPHLELPARAGIYLAVVLTTVPALLILHHSRAVFAAFSKGKVFNAATLANMRGAAQWLAVSAFSAAIAQIVFNGVVGIRPIARDLDLRPIMLFFGIGTYIAAHVMAEARRIADDNAGFV